MTSQWVMMLLGMPIVKSQWVMIYDVVRTSIMTSQWVITFLCVHIMASRCIMTLIWTFSNMYSLLHALLYYFIVEYGIKTRTSSCLISLGWRTNLLFLCWLFLSSFGLVKYPNSNTTCMFSQGSIKHSLVLVIY